MREAKHCHHGYRHPDPRTPDFSDRRFAALFRNLNCRSFPLPNARRPRATDCLLPIPFFCQPARRAPHPVSQSVTIDRFLPRPVIRNPVSFGPFVESCCSHWSACGRLPCAFHIIPIVYTRVQVSGAATRQAPAPAVNERSDCPVPSSHPSFRVCFLSFLSPLRYIPSTLQASHPSPTLNALKARLW